MKDSNQLASAGAGSRQSPTGLGHVPLKRRNSEIYPYAPHVLLISRMVIVIMWWIYYLNFALPPLLVDLAVPFAAGVFYPLVHLLLHLKMRRDGARLREIRLQIILDIIITHCAWLIDPNMPSPLLLLVVLVVIGDGLQYGFQRFFPMFVISMTATIAIYGVRINMLGSPAGETFFLLFCGVLLFYTFQIVRRIQTYKELAEYSSRRDPLTGLYNRRGFEGMMRYLLSVKQRSGLDLVIMMADLDDFKQINDRYGHARGDEVLCRIAEIATSTFRRTDIYTRIGGDEFVFVLSGATAENAQRVAERFEKGVALYAAETGLEFGVSVGVVEVAEDQLDLDAVLGLVDEEMYKNKAAKRN